MGFLRDIAAQRMSLDNEDAVWFKRFGDIPGVKYTTPAHIDRERLPRVSAVPRIYRTYDGKDQLDWSRGANGSTSASPAAERAYDDLPKGSIAKVCDWLAETLELPGQRLDYHFAIQHVVSELWRRRSTDPDALSELERVAWIDIDFVQVEPDMLRFDMADGTVTYGGVVAFGHLVTMYERELAWTDAVRVAKINRDVFGHHSDKYDKLAAIVAEQG